MTGDCCGKRSHLPLDTVEARNRRTLGNGHNKELVTEQMAEHWKKYFGPESTDALLFDDNGQ